MDALKKRTDGDYLLSIFREYKYTCYYEIKARNIYSGKFYDVQFYKNRYFIFFIYENNVWKSYTVPLSEKYNRSTLNSVSAFKNLENDLKKSRDLPLLYIKNDRIIKNRFKNSSVLKYHITPSLPFYFARELGNIDIEEEIARYKYYEPTKFIVIAKYARHDKETENNSCFLFGCNSEKLYNSLHEGSVIEVTHPRSKAKAFVCGKAVNHYSIVPVQRCLRKI